MSNPFHRVVFPVQKPGELGKSTFLSLVASWCRFADVEFDACDADVLNRTFHEHNPGSVELFDGVSSPDAFHRLLLSIDPRVPLTLIDFPGQRTEFLLGSPATGDPGVFDRFKVLKGWGKAGLRATVILFASNEKKAIESAVYAYARLGDAVDYLIVENPARFKSDVFDQTGLAKRLRSAGTPTVVMAPIGDVTREGWAGVRGLGRLEKRVVTLDEAVGHGSLDEFSQHEVGHYRDQGWAQLETVAVPFLVPTADLIKNKVARTDKELAMETVNVWENPLS